MVFDFSGNAVADSSLDSLRHAVNSDPLHAGKRYQLAMALAQHAQSISLASPQCTQWLQEAIDQLSRIVAQDPLHVDAWAMLGYLNIYRNRPEDAERAVRRALALNPDHAASLVNLSNLQLGQCRFDEARATLQHAVRATPHNPWAHYNLGQTCLKSGQGDAALAHTLRAFELLPDNKDILDALLLQSVYSSQLDDTEKFRLHRQYETLVNPDGRTLAPHVNDPDPQRPLRLGLVSGDFAHASLMYVTLPVLARLDGAGFQLFFYHHGVAVDMVTEQLQAIPGVQWRFTRGLDTDTLCALVQDDQIDILVDMSGHVEYNALAAFARKPAPVQLSWAAYPATTGLSCMDYVITDPTLWPPSSVQQRFWTEQPCHMPDSFVVYQPYIRHPQRGQDPAYAVQPSPALRRGRITFGSGTSLARLTPVTVALWTRVLDAVPGSRLKLECNCAPDIVSALFTAQGLAPDRIEASERSPETQYLFYHDIDIALDGTPSNGGVTSLDTLWMGVPLVTLRGDVMASRLGASFLAQLGRERWVADSAEQFVAIACALAADLPALERARQALRPAMQASPLMDVARFVDAFSQRLHAMWQTWCASPAAETARDLQQQREALALCDALMQQEDHASALQAYRMVLAQWPDSLDALYGLGLALLFSRHATEAISILEKVRDILSTHGPVQAHAECLAALGQAWLMQGDPAKAQTCLLASLDISPSDEVRMWVRNLQENNPPDPG